MTSKLGIEALIVLSSASDDEWVRYFERLRGERRLSAAMRELNRLLADTQCAARAATALKRVRLWHVG